MPDKPDHPALAPRRIEVFVHPRASRRRVAEVGGALHVWLTAAPVDDAANQELIELVAKHSAVPKSRVRIVRGRTSRRKLLEIG